MTQIFSKDKIPESLFFEITSLMSPNTGYQLYQASELLFEIPTKSSLSNTKLRTWRSA